MIKTWNECIALSVRDTRWWLFFHHCQTCWIWFLFLTGSSNGSARLETCVPVLPFASLLAVYLPLNWRQHYIELRQHASHNEHQLPRVSCTIELIIELTRINKFVDMIYTASRITIWIYGTYSQSFMFHRR